MLSVLPIYLGVGAIAGVLAGMLGVGGGVIIVPALVIALTYQAIPESVVMHVAIGTSLATIVATSIASVSAHHQRGAVDWRVFAMLTPGIVMGALAGALIAGWLPADVLRRTFAVFALLVALQLGLDFKPPASRQLPGTPGMGLAGLLIGAVSAVVGIGGGSMTVPFLTWCNVPVLRAVATSAACGLPIAVAGALGFVATGWNHPGLPPYSSGFIHWPAFVGVIATSALFAGLGAKLAHTLSSATLKRVFALFLLCVSLYLFLN